MPKIFNVPVRAPEAAGVNVSNTVQEAAAAIVPAFTQVPPDRAKSVALVPVNVKKGVPKTWVVVPLFVTVTVSAPLVVFTF